MTGKNQYELLVGSSYDLPYSIAKATEQVKNLIEDASVVEVHVHGETQVSGVASERGDLGIGLLIQTSEEDVEDRFYEEEDYGFEELESVQVVPNQYA